MVSRARRIAGRLWAGPLSLLGLLAVLTSGARYVSSAGDARHYHGYKRYTPLWLFFTRQPDVAGFALGEVVIYRHITHYRSQALRQHELRHVEQYRRLGLFFLPLYFLVLSPLAWILGRDAYRWNLLEIDAREDAGQETI